MADLYADIIVDITHEKLDHSFQYRIPDSLADQVKIGDQVRIPFGRTDHLTPGYVIGIGDKPNFDPTRIKEIHSLSKDAISLETRLIALASWIRDTYGSTMIQALKTVLPVKEKRKIPVRSFLTLTVSKEEGQALRTTALQKNRKAQARVLEILLQKGSVEKGLLYKEAKVSAATLKPLFQAGVLKETSKEVPRDLRSSGTMAEGQDAEQNSTENPEGKGGKGLRQILTPLQQEICQQIQEGWSSGDSRPVLLRGVTGSGKTNVYMDLIQKTLEEGRQAILLIPEISLTWQMMQRFRQRFGNQILILHSRLTKVEREEQLERVFRGEAHIVVGPRSALFTPFPNLGLILVDEEHETSYQSEGTPRYHAREVAIKRGELENARVLLGSATPSVDSYFHGEQGDYRLFTMDERYGQAVLPKVSVVDMREELRNGNGGIISLELRKALEENLAKGQQSMLFLNRRGYVGFISCRSCGMVIKCPHCDVSMTYHNNGKMICHYCGYTRGQLDKCPSCGSPYIGGFRAGTQQIETLVRKQFPGIRVLRMDADTTRGREGHDKILKAFASGEADVLIGTQMIVKGHDFPNVTLVAALAADTSLSASDYRAGERTFQLLVQAIGRAGRGSTPGRAIIQTYQPDHYSIQASVSQDYEAFYQEEMSGRDLMGYPPASNLLAIHGACPDEAYLQQAFDYLKQFLLRLPEQDQLSILGPAPEPVAKVQDQYRYCLYMKGVSGPILRSARRKLEAYLEINPGFAPINFQFDLNK